MAAMVSAGRARGVGCITVTVPLRGCHRSVRHGPRRCARRPPPSPAYWPAHFTVTLTTVLHLHHYTLAGAADAAAYAHSGYPSVASYVLSDTLSGGILAGLVLGPVVLLGVAFLGAGAGTGLRELAARRASA
jgi:hypothetical protein